MEGFESKLAEATRLGDRDLLGAVAVVIDNKGEIQCYPPRVSRHVRLQKKHV
jgi:hypothetical protein